MRPFTYRGKTYRSLCAFSRAHGVSYDKLLKLCRRFKRAHADPTVAADWLLGHADFDPQKEPKTGAYLREQQLAKARQIVFRARRRAHELKLAAHFI